MPPTNGISPWCRLRKLGLSTRPIFFAIFRAKKRKIKVSKKILNNSVTAVSKFTMHALSECWSWKYNDDDLAQEAIKRVIHRVCCMFFNQLGHSYSECSVISRAARSILWLRGYSVYSAKEKRHVKRGVSGLYLDYARAIKSGTARFSRIFTSACRCKPPSNHSQNQQNW